MSANQIQIDLLLNDKDALAKLKTAMGQVESASNRTTESIAGGFIAASVSLEAAEKAIGLVVDIMKEAVNQAAEQEQAVNRLNNALKLQGFTSAMVGRQYQEMASEMQRNSRFADDAILAVQQRLVTIGNVVPSQMKRVTQATLDLASATGIDLEQASMLLAKAAAGETAALGRYGIVLDENLSKSEKFEAALKFIGDRMGGSALADTNSFKGAQEQLGHAINDVLKELGNFVVKEPGITKGMQAMTAETLGFAKAIAEIREQHPDALFTALAGTMQNIGKMVIGGPAGLGQVLGESLGKKAAGQSIASQMFGSVDKNKADAQAAADAAKEAADRVMADQEQAEVERKARLKAVDDFFLDSKTQGLISNSIQGEIIKNEQTQRDIMRAEDQISTFQKVANLDAATQAKLFQYKVALVEAEKNLEKAKAEANLKIMQARIQKELALVSASADLANSLAVATGSSGLKAIAVVLQAAVAAAQAIIAIKAAVNPLDAITAGVKLAVVAVNAANALSQIGAAEKALQASNVQIQVPGFAGGVTNFSGGLAVVGERGPELVRLPAGSDVIPNGKSGGLGETNIYITLNSPVITTEESARSVAREMASYVSEYIDNERRRI